MMSAQARDLASQSLGTLSFAPMIFSSGLAAAAARSWSRFSPARTEAAFALCVRTRPAPSIPSHLRPLPVSRNSAWQGRREGTEGEGRAASATQRREGVYNSAGGGGRASVEGVPPLRSVGVGRVASRLQAKLQATTHGLLANELVPTSQGGCEAFGVGGPFFAAHTVTVTVPRARVFPHTGLWGEVAFWIRGSGWCF